MTTHRASQSSSANGSCRCNADDANVNDDDDVVMSSRLETMRSEISSAAVQHRKLVDQMMMTVAADDDVSQSSLTSTDSRSASVSVSPTPTEWVNVQPHASPSQPRLNPTQA